MNLSYNISENLSSLLSKIDSLRSRILLTPISPANELKLKWGANLERIIWSLSMADNPLSRREVIRLVTSQSASPKKKLSAEEKDVLSYKNAYAYIKNNWTVNKNPVTMTTIKHLYEISCKDTIGKMTGLTEYSEKRINSLLEYLSKGTDHPFIQAGIVQSEFVNITPFDDGNGRVARLLSYLYLYKTGFDIKETVTLEEHYKNDIVTYRRMLEASKVTGNMTTWLEYFTLGAAPAIEKALDVVQNLKFQKDIPSAFWKLNDRQKNIMEKLEQPGERVTNKSVQKKYKVSQITASRDLAKLTNLGLLLAHGKGRSVYYTRV